MCFNMDSIQVSIKWLSNMAPNVNFTNQKVDKDPIIYSDLQ